ncbi:uncharacterized protein LOC133923040 [Phragmites australis]|uniref:uncharacterized protein LOC133923040 n=1 Tax=Phragmites australis TaxID=29695 RepID=UPI002D7931E6|nr:uncharacterized protein LOC133923040 [Phragmites australis]
MPHAPAGCALLPVPPRVASPLLLSNPHRHTGKCPLHAKLAMSNRRETQKCGCCVTFSMDLNASPLPEQDEPIEVQYVESAVATMRREREERCRRLKREQQDEGSMLHSQQIMNDYAPKCETGRHGHIKEAPQGWMECPAFGEPIQKTIPSKVPLDETFNESVPPRKRYSSKQVLNIQRKAGHDIGLVIDLTNTTRYYSPEEWTRQGIKHVKIPCKGRDVVPDNEFVNTFVFDKGSFIDS